jgi:DNA helicase-2/ATP-dependent DNA helicase PcrA
MSEYDGVEEERRLAYVAITRARRRLYLTHAQSRMLHGQLRYNVASRFLDEVPAAMLQWLSPKHGNFAAEPEALAGRNAAERIRDGAGWRIGQSVKHSRFGLGIIIDAEGRGTDARVQVNFRDGGVKWLALEYAKLQPA